MHAGAARPPGRVHLTPPEQTHCVAAAARLERDDVVALDPERKAAMVSNLLVVLCGDQRATPVVNTGSLYT